MCVICRSQKLRQYCMIALMHGPADPQLHRELQEALLTLLSITYTNEPASGVELAPILDFDSGTFYHGEDGEAAPLFVKVQRYWRGLVERGSEENPIIIN